MIVIDVVSLFFMSIKLIFMVSLILSVSVIFYQVWVFIVLVLYKYECRLVVSLLVFSFLLFYIGMVFVYFVVFLLVFGFFVNIVLEGV